MPSVHNGVMLRWQRQIQKARTCEAVAAAMDTLTCLEAASCIEYAISWNDADHQNDDAEYCEDDVDWHTGECDDELEESAHTVGTPTDDPELL